MLFCCYTSFYKKSLSVILSSAGPSLSCWSSLTSLLVWLLLFSPSLFFYSLYLYKERIFKILLYLLIYWGGGEDNLGPVLFFHHMGSGDQTREVMRLIASIFTRKTVLQALEEVIFLISVTRYILLEMEPLQYQWGSNISWWWWKHCPSMTLLTHYNNYYLLDDIKTLEKSN